MRHLSSIFKALSDETRLLMLALLMRRGELCVCDFVSSLSITQSKASRHLRYLANSGLVTDRRDALWVFYRIAERPAPGPAAVLKALGPVLGSCDIEAVERRLDAWLRVKTATAACRGPAPRVAARSRRKG